MGNPINIDWSAGSNMNPQGPLGVVNQGYAGAEEGYKLGQQRAMVHALQGVDLSNPSSVDAGIGNLVRANAGEQANALQNLSFTRQLRSQIPAMMAKLTGQGQDPSSQAPAPSPSVADHAIETFQLAQKATDQLAATPQADRPAAFAKIKADMVARGIPEAAIDAAGQDLSDQGLAGLSQHYGQLLANAQHQMSGAQGEPPGVTPHPSNNWYDKVVNDPQIPMAVGLLKSAGVDFSPYLQTARELAQPGINKQAELAYAGPIAATQAGVDVAKAGAMVPIEAAKAGAVEGATNPYKAALAKATADIAAQHDLVSVPETGSDGNPTGRMITYRKDTALNAGSGGKGIGSAQSPQEAAGKTDDAHIFMNKYEQEANQPAIQADKSARDQSLAAAHMAQTLNPSNLTPWLAKNANTLNGLGIKIAAKDANNLSTYQTLVAQNLKSAIQVFPRNMGEFHAITNAVADAKSPGDAAALALTETAAIHDAAAQQKQFRIDYAAQHPGEYSERAFQTAWAAQPGANQSVFASPLFRDLKVNGKPAVTVYPQPYKDGHTYGVFMPGTPQKTVFRVQ